MVIGRLMVGVDLAVIPPAIFVDDFAPSRETPRPSITAPRYDSRRASLSVEGGAR